MDPIQTTATSIMQTAPEPAGTRSIGLVNAPTWFKPEDRPSPRCDDPTINRVELVGYVGQEPEQRRTSQQELIVSFGLATHRLLQGSDGDTKQLTDWHRVIADGAVAMAAAELRRGALEGGW